MDPSVRYLPMDSAASSHGLLSRRRSMIGRRTTTAAEFGYEGK
jgi:hypothetical protein